MIIAVAVADVVDRAALGQLIADAVGRCEWPSVAVVSSVDVREGVQAGGSARFLVVVRTHAPQRPLDKKLAMAMVQRHVSAALRIEHGTLVRCTCELVSADVVAQMTGPGTAEAWITEAR